MTSRKFLFGGMLVVFSLAFVLFLVRCSFTPIRPLEDPRQTEDITIITTTTTEIYLTSTVSTTCDKTTVYQTTVTTEETVIEITETYLQETDIAFLQTDKTEVSTEIVEVEFTDPPLETTPGDKRVKIGGSFTGTYYPSDKNSGLNGGSGRSLIGCEVGDGTVRGSVACKYVYDRYKYNYSGGRTMVYIEVPQFPNMNGYYYVDDCCASNCVIDFYWKDPSQCPFYDPIGVAKDIQLWIVEE